MKKLLAALAAISVFAVAPLASATNYNLWVHGRTSQNAGITLAQSKASYQNFTYWNGDNGVSVATGSNKVAVNWDAQNHISVAVPLMSAALDQYCLSGSGNSCFIECHSAGCALIGQTEAIYPGRWSIINVRMAGSADGGSELANVGKWLTGWGIDSDLSTGTMRNMYNHDAVGDHIAGGVLAYMGGDWSSATNTFFPCNSSFLGVCYSWAANDSVVAFHSSGRFRSTNGAQSDSNTMSEPTINNLAQYSSAGNGSWWDYTSSIFVDANDGHWGHCVASTWWSSIGCKEGNEYGNSGGIVGLMAARASIQ
jgi:hypothetical protein